MLEEAASNGSGNDRAAGFRHWWLVFAFSTLVCFAGQNELDGAIGQEAASPPDVGFSNGQVQALECGLFGLASLCWLRLRGGRGPLSFVPAWVLLLQFSCGVVMAGGNLLLACTLAKDFHSKALISAVLPLNAVPLAVMCWVFIGERLTLVQGIGILVAVVGLVLMACANVTTKRLEGAAFGLVSACCYAVANFGIKVSSKRGLSSAHGWAICLLWLGMGLVGVVAFGTGCLMEGGCLAGMGELNAKWGPGESNRLYIFSVLSGVCQALAVGSLKLGVTLGCAAPVIAIANSNAIVVLVLDEIFFTPSNAVLKLVGLAVVIVGIAIIALAPLLAERKNAPPLQV